MAEGIGERIGEDIGEGRWLTYTELAEIRGIGRESAVKLAQRERWRKLSGNSPDRTVRVFVPAEWLKPAKGGHVGEGFPEGFGELSRLVSDLQDTVAFVRERAEAAEARADAADADRRTAEARAEAERARADQAEEDRRAAEVRADAADADRRVALSQVEELQRDRDAARVIAQAAQRAAREEVERAQAEARTAQEAAAALRGADEARKARGLPARLWSAWRGT
jgi:hypothetical protein